VILLLATLPLALQQIIPLIDYLFLGIRQRPKLPIKCNQCCLHSLNLDVLLTDCELKLLFFFMDNCDAIFKVDYNTCLPW